MSSLAKKALRTVAGAAAGSFIGLVVGSTIGAAYVELFNVSDFEGYSAYVVGYCFMLPGISIGAFVGGFLAFKDPPRLHRKWNQGEADQID